MWGWIAGIPIGLTIGCLMNVDVIIREANYNRGRLLSPERRKSR